MEPTTLLVLGSVAMVLAIAIWAEVQWLSTPPSGFTCPNTGKLVHETGESRRPELHRGDEVGYRCEYCDALHVYNWDFGPAASYVGDKITLKVTCDGLVQQE